MDNEKCVDMAVKVQEIDSRCKSNEHRIENLEKDMDKLQETQITLIKLANGVDKMADQLVDMKSDIKDVKESQKDLSNKVVTLENRPAVETKRKWDSFMEKVIWILASGALGYLLATAFPKIF